MQYQIQGKKKMKRQIFEGSTKFTDLEESELVNLNKHLTEKKQENVIQNWKKSDIVRFILGNQFNLKNCAKSMEEHNQWKKQTLPV